MKRASRGGVCLGVLALDSIFRRLPKIGSKKSQLEFTQDKMDLGVDRIKRLLALLGSPQTHYKVIHVAGTNGKGSVCATLSSVCSHLGIRNGRFSSPHLIHPCDSITVNQTPIPVETFTSLKEQIESLSTQHQIHATSFEILTAVAFCYFSQAQIQLAVVEVGMGGRLDSTNVFDHPTVCVITSIGLDHTEFLGDKLGKIASEKAGIMKKDAGVVLGYQAGGAVEGVAGEEDGRKEILEVLEGYAKEVGCSEIAHAVPLVPSFVSTPSQPSFFDILSHTPSSSFTFQHIRSVTPSTVSSSVSASASASPSPSSSLSSDSLPTSSPITIKFQLPFAGSYQLQNLSTALTALDLFLKKEPQFLQYFSIEPLIRGIECTKWPGRLEWRLFKGSRTVEGTNEGIPILIDGAHNIQGAHQLRDYLDACLLRAEAQLADSGAEGSNKEKIRVIWVVGFKYGKDIGELLQVWLGNDKDRNKRIKEDFEEERDELWAVEFSQPEGMPWIRATVSTKIVEVADKINPEVKGQTFDGPRAVFSRLDSDESFTKGTKTVVVLCGSLYLVSEFYKLNIL
jgi:folylpolyglutamate synthase/dihydropteroate synthase